MSFPISQFHNFLAIRSASSAASAVNFVLPFAQQPHDKREDDANNDAGSDGKIKTEVFPLNGDISGKPSDF